MCTDYGSLSFLPQKVGRSQWETFMVSAPTASFQSSSETQRAASNAGLNSPYPAVGHTESSNLKNAHSAGEMGSWFWPPPGLCVNTPDSMKRTSSRELFQVEPCGSFRNLFMSQESKTSSIARATVQILDDAAVQIQDLLRWHQQ